MPVSSQHRCRTKSLFFSGDGQATKMYNVNKAISLYTVYIIDCYDIG